MNKEGVERTVEELRNLFSKQLDLRTLLQFISLIIYSLRIFEHHVAQYDRENVSMCSPPSFDMPFSGNDDCKLNSPKVTNRGYSQQIELGRKLSFKFCNGIAAIHLACKTFHVDRS